MHAKSLRRLSAIGGLATGAVLLLAVPASAHVSVNPDEAEQGGYATVNFKVPNERDNASTVKLEVTLPEDHPLTSAMPQPVPGWDVKVSKKKLDKPIESHGEKITEVVSKITWTGGKIQPGEFQQFPVSVGQLPEDADQLVFKALQTYDKNNEVVRWIEEPKEGEPEPESPAPVLKLVPAKDGGHGDDAKAGAGQASADKDTANAGAESDDSGSDTTARALGIVGIVVGAAGVAFGVLARRKSA
ncbi:YcnI family protein [Streptomyces boninensis]|uniref:YcnI family copper-binding membrane protein n=1 Tax=Streptomyces boninensis TaxID=2039455 RepID=UPI003B220B60